MQIKYKDNHKAHIQTSDQYDKLYQKSLESSDHFWSEQADRIDWYKKWDKISDVDYSSAHIRWFENGKLNASYNCLDRHIENGFGDNIALIWEGNNPDENKRSKRH